MITAAAPAVYPVRLLSPGSFTQLREFLQNIGFHKIDIEKTLRINAFGDPSMRVQMDLGALEGALRIMGELFFAGLGKEPADVTSMLGDDFTRLLESFGLLQRLEDGRLASTVALYPSNDLLIVSDRWAEVNGDYPQFAPDVVYPAIQGTTRGFLAMVPASPCERFLEACAGTGIAAMLAAKNGTKHAWAADLAARSVYFAEFNRRLNGLDNVTCVQGDLYGPLKGGTKFDRIVAHPPYVPVLEPKYVFYDGGEDGEQIVRRLIQELPEVLDDKGLFLCVSLGTDRKDNPFEQRVRAWLGDKADEFDVAFFVRTEMEPAVQALRDVVRGRGSIEEVQKWREILAKLQISNFVFGATYIHRHAQRRKGYTIRRTMGEDSGLADVGRILDWERAVASGAAVDLLRTTPLEANPTIRLEATYMIENHAWAAGQQHLIVDKPFKMNLEAPNWTLRILELCDGTLTGPQILEKMQQEEIIGADTTFEHFCNVLISLVSGGYIALVEKK